MGNKTILSALMALGGVIGGWIGFGLGLPMPFMLGGIAGTGVAVALIERRVGQMRIRMPHLFRSLFIGLIGAMIGASFTPGLLAALPRFWISALAVLLFIALAHLVGYAVMRRVGRYSQVTALYASMPGGLVEATILGEKAGADVQVLAVQHFCRVIMVVMAVPILFWIVTGEVVGSASGAALSLAGWDWGDIGSLVVLAVAGIAIGRTLRIPAGQLMGPLFLCGFLQISGVVDLVSPPWLLHLAQLVVGIGLGSQFSGLKRQTLVTGVGTAALAVTLMMCLSFGFAYVLQGVAPGNVATLFLSFAPGGVTEMSLIALSLSLSPAIVAVHHLIRIVVTVIFTDWLGKWLGF